MTLLRLTLAAALTSALAGVAAAKPVTLGNETNLRAAPGTKSDVVTLMPKGATVEVGDCDAGWCKVTFEDKEGFAIARNLGQAPPARRVARRYVEDDYDDDGYGPVYAVPPPPPPVYYGYYPYPGPFYYGWGRGHRHRWHRW